MIYFEWAYIYLSIMIYLKEFIFIYQSWYTLNELIFIYQSWYTFIVDQMKIKNIIIYKTGVASVYEQNMGECWS